MDLVYFVYWVLRFFWFKMRLDTGVNSLLPDALICDWTCSDDKFLPDRDFYFIRLLSSTRNGSSRLLTIAEMSPDLNLDLVGY